MNVQFSEIHFKIQDESVYMLVREEVLPPPTDVISLTRYRL